MKRFFCFTLLMLAAVIVGCDSGDNNSQNALSNSDNTDSNVVASHGCMLPMVLLPSGYCRSRCSTSGSRPQRRRSGPYACRRTGSKAILEDLITQQVDGVAVSPIDSDNQLDLLNLVADETTLITRLRCC